LAKSQPSHFNIFESKAQPWLNGFLQKSMSPEYRFRSEYFNLLFQAIFCKNNILIRASREWIRHTRTPGESKTTCTAAGLDFTAKGGNR
jgi:hypothetical protein